MAPRTLRSLKSKLRPPKSARGVARRAGMTVPKSASGWAQAIAPSAPKRPHGQVENVGDPETAVRTPFVVAGLTVAGLVVFLGMLVSVCAGCKPSPRSAKGESCTKTADCVGGLSCVNLVCVDRAELETEEEAVADAANKAAEKKDAALAKLQRELQEMEAEARQLEEQLASATSDEAREAIMRKQEALRVKMRTRRTERRHPSTP